MAGVELETCGIIREIAIMECAHDAAEQAHRLWQRSRELTMLAENTILDIKRLCERTQVSIDTSRMILKQNHPTPSS